PAGQLRHAAGRASGRRARIPGALPCRPARGGAAARAVAAAALRGDPALASAARGAQVPPHLDGLGLAAARSVGALACRARRRAVPELRFIADYHEHPGYIEALRASVTEHWLAHGRTPHLLISFHGIPERYVQHGDPYFGRCQTTARLLADELLLRDGQWSVSFQSRFGPTGWLKPYTRTVLTGMPARGLREVTVVCPGF